MRYREFGIQEASLSQPTDDKYIVAVNRILAQPNPKFLVGKNGERGTLIADDDQYITDRTDKITGYLNKQYVEVKVSALFKSDELKQSIGVSLGTTQKESFVIKPSQIFKDERFSANQVFAEIINNPILQKTEIGQAIISMAQQIEKGKLPNFSDLPTEFQTPIRDYAGEYLGVCSLIKGIANFPTRNQWFKHLGVSDLSKIFIHFPQKPNFALGDSIGSFENAETGNVILISSKGGKKGAPPSLNGLKIPDDIASKNAYANEVDFITTLQNSSADVQPFEGINKLYNLNKDSINKVIQTVLPLSINDINEILQFFDKSQYIKDDWVNLPKKYHPIIGLIQANLNRFSKTSTPGGILHYIMNKEIINAVNNNNALPNFEPLAREILQKNFIQIFSRPKGSVLGFDIVWPNLQMGTGKIELYSKASANDPKSQKMSFSVT